MFGYAQGKSERLHASSKLTESYNPQHFTPTQSKDFPPYMTYEGLASFLQSLHGKSPSPSLSELEQGKQKVEPHNHVLLVVLAFDEAHTTTQQHQATGEEWSVFNELHHTLWLPLFSLFLSTTGKISQFTSAIIKVLWSVEMMRGAGNRFRGGRFGDNYGAQAWRRNGR